MLSPAAAAESISLDHANPNPSGNKGANKEDKPAAGPLSDDIHPPPTILNIDLVRMLERHLSRVGRTGAEDKGAACDKGVGEGGAKAGEQQGCERARKPAAAAAGVPDIGPTRTMHLQMTPMVSALAASLIWGIKEAPAGNLGRFPPQDTAGYVHVTTQLNAL